MMHGASLWVGCSLKIKARDVVHGLERSWDYLRIISVLSEIRASTTEIVTPYARRRKEQLRAGTR